MMDFLEESIVRLKKFPEKPCVYDFKLKKIFTNKDFLEHILFYINLNQQENKKRKPVLIPNKKGVKSYSLMLACGILGLPFVCINERSRSLIVGKDKYFDPDIVSKIDKKEKEVIYSRERSNNEIFYLISTSGSTSQPKLIQVSYKNFSTYIKNINRVQPMLEGTVSSQAFDLSFDPAIGEIFYTLSVGGVLAPFDFSSLLAFPKWLEETKTIRWGSSPAHAALIVERLFEQKFPQLRESSFIGEALNLSLVDKWTDIFTNSKVLNHYGPAELTVSISSHEFRRSEKEQVFNNVISIGEVYSDHKWVLIDSDESVNFKEGELCVFGEQSMIGYVEGEAKYFLHHGKKFLRTGDLVKNNNNRLFYLGRTDDMIKIKSQRVHSLEIENFIRKEFGIGALVFVSEFNEYMQGQRISVIIDELVSSEIHTLIIESISKTFGELLIPKSVYFLQSFAINQSGKIDRKKIIEKALLGQLRELDTTEI
jgi:D-alanine--poly(phosphoribitol) ligase subunit 1